MGAPTEKKLSLNKMLGSYAKKFGLYPVEPTGTLQKAVGYQGDLISVDNRLEWRDASIPSQSLSSLI